uniref:Uncharacterized protein n=1 Tax=Arundo donax TaxID=35708 RepID=A0A0A8YTJ6_ARUDO
MFLQNPSLLLVQTLVPQASTCSGSLLCAHLICCGRPTLFQPLSYLEVSQLTLKLDCG